MINIVRGTWTLIENIWIFLEGKLQTKIGWFLFGLLISGLLGGMIYFIKDIAIEKRERDLVQSNSKLVLENQELKNNLEIWRERTFTIREETKAECMKDLKEAYQFLQEVSAKNLSPSVKEQEKQVNQIKKDTEEKKKVLNEMRQLKSKI